MLSYKNILLSLLSNNQKKANINGVSLIGAQKTKSLLATVFELIKL
jgi:hypothetical protein